MTSTTSTLFECFVKSGLFHSTNSIAENRLDFSVSRCQRCRVTVATFKAQNTRDFFGHFYRIHTNLLWGDLLTLVGFNCSRHGIELTCLHFLKS